ncbi:MAG: 50S ribosomal protein L15 [Opitutales bacterium]|nr:50S ribosomal protein L15 [Opitutales bacterium]
MELHSIIDSNGANRPKRRVGSGEGNGHGKTCGRGHKGARARSGYSHRPGFEGGQMPLYLRIPHRGFSNARHRTDFEVLNVRDLAKFDPSKPVDIAAVVEAGMVPSGTRFLKLLSMGEVDKAYTVVVQKASAAAIAKIEKAGGKVVLPEQSSES